MTSAEVKLEGLKHVFWLPKPVTAARLWDLMPVCQPSKTHQQRAQRQLQVATLVDVHPRVDFEDPDRS